MNCSQNARQTKGNALFLVLLGIALFAALSFTVSQGSNTMTAEIDEERAGLLADEILGYSKQLEHAVKVILVNDYSEQDISFKHADLHADYDHGAPTGAEVFNISGGGAKYRTFPDATSDDWFFTGRSNVPNIGSFGETYLPASCDDYAQCTELIAILPNIPINLCLKLNEKLDVAERSSGLPPKDEDYVNGTRFNGTYTLNTVLGDSGGLLYGKRSACFEGGSDNANLYAEDTYNFYHVLLAR